MSVTQKLVICTHCDAVHTKQVLKRGEKARCHCCRAVLYRYQYFNARQVLPLCLAGLMAWGIANMWPVLSVSISGIKHSVTLPGAIAAMWQGQAYAMAAMVAASLVVIPLIQLLLLAWGCLFACANRQAPGLAGIIRWLHYLNPWSIIEVWVLGIIVATVKLHSVFNINMGTGTWAFVALMILVTCVSSWNASSLFDVATREKA